MPYFGEVLLQLTVLWQWHSHPKGSGFEAVALVAHLPVKEPSAAL